MKRVARILVSTALFATGTTLVGGHASAGQASFSCSPTPAVYPVATSGDIGGVVAGSLDGHHRPAVVTANAAGTATVFLNHGRGSLVHSRKYSLSSTTSTVDGSESPLLVDLNGDGKLDLVTANQYSNDVSVLLGRGGETFNPAITYPVGDLPVSLVAGDFNGDGHIDLVTINRDALDTAGHIAVLFGNGDGTFRLAQIINLAMAMGPGSNLVAADFNGDGVPDLAYSGIGDNGHTAVVLLNRGKGSFSPAVTYTVGEGAFAIATGRVNGDRFPDLVTANVSDSTFSILLNKADGTGTFAPAMPTATAGGQLDVTLADVNGDGRADIVAANPFNGNVWVLPNQGQGGFGTPINCPVALAGSSVRGPLHVTTADLNGDGKSDIITSNFGFGTASISVLLTP